jgi:hypothetical protein
MHKPKPNIKCRCNSCDTYGIHYTIVHDSDDKSVSYSKHCEECGATSYEVTAKSLFTVYVASAVAVVILIYFLNPLNLLL